MAKVNKEGYIYRQTSKHVSRDWWLIKHVRGKEVGFLSLKGIYFPKENVGKRIKIKIEVIEENKK